MISFRNISRAALNITADELMERFVRGDSSRTTEGSGLGLSIAKSLTELQHGDFAIEIDGDLFKARVTLPRAAEPSAPAAQLVTVTLQPTQDGAAAQSAPDQAAQEYVGSDSNAAE